MAETGIPDVAGPRMPLARDAFADALQKGLGRAMMHVRRHGAGGVDDLLLAGCLHNQAYDPQCEGDRAEWMLSLLDAGGLADALCPTILRAVRDAPANSNFWDITQLCRFAELLAGRNQPQARESLYSAFRPSDESADLIAGQEIIALDGADGLLWVAGRLGQWILDNRDSQADETPVVWFEEQHGAGTAEALLRSAAVNDARIAAYVERLDRLAEEQRGVAGNSARPRGFRSLRQIRFAGDAADRHRARMRAITATDVIRHIEENDPAAKRYWAGSWGRAADEADLEIIYEKLLAETDTSRLCKYLRVFTGRAVPRFDERLLTLVHHGDADVRWVALRVLAQIRHPAVRALALERLRAGNVADGALSLLDRNYERGDHELIERAMHLPDELNALHSLISDLVDLFERNPDPCAARALRFAYEFTPCGNCRHKAVEILLQTHTAPKWLLEECRSDVQERTRAAVEGANTHE